jgi:hypothetical protein
MIYNSFKKTTCLIIFFLAFFSLTSNAEIIKTPAEEANYTRYSQHEDIARFLSAVDCQSKEMTVQVIGKTKEVEGFPSKDIFLCIINEEGASNPQDLNRKRPTFLLIASQHGNEQSAKEAALWMIRDLALGELRPLLKSINFLIIPQANPYGNYFDQRQNEIDLDMNRDHLKLEAEGVLAIHRIFRTWMPEVTIDVHEKGDDYYRVSSGCVSNINIHSNIQEYSRNNILTQVERSLAKKGFTFHEYLVEEEMGVNTAAGASLRPEETAGKEMMMRYSTTDLNDGRNSLGIYETLSFIQEGASRHDLETLRERTIWQYWGIRSLAEAIAQNGEEVLKLVGRLRKELLEKAKNYSEQNLIHLRMDFARDDKNPSLTIKRFESSESPIEGIMKVDKKVGETLLASDLDPYPYPPKQKVVTKIVKNWFPKVIVKLSVPQPLGYIIASRHLDVVETLLRHGISVAIFTQDKLLEVEAYETREVIPAKYDYLAPEKIEVEKRRIQTIIKKGDFYVSCAQPAANLIACLLEPQADYGFIRYWKFKLVPEKGDTFAFYRLTKGQDLPLIPYRDWTR